MCLHRCFIQPLQHLATLKVLRLLHSLPLYCEGESEWGNDRDRLFTTTPSFLPVLAWGRQKRWGLGDIGAAVQLRRVQLGAPGGTEGHRMELRVWASRILNPLGGWSPLSTPILSLSNSLSRPLAPLLFQHLQEKRLAHPLWPALELWCGSQWHRLDSFRARLESLMGELRGQAHRGSRCLCCCAVLLVGSLHSHY